MAGHHEFEIADGSSVKLALRYKRVGVLPPIGKARRYPPLSLTVIHATAINPPEGRKPIDWKLYTDLAVGEPDQALENGLVFNKMEDQAVLQNTQIRFQRRETQTASGRAFG